MPRPALRVVLDSNVFSAAHFEAIFQSRFQQLCRRGRIVVVYGGEMLDETLRAYTAERTRFDLVTKWIPLILQTATRFCDELPSIWHKELVQGLGTKASELMSPARDLNVREHLAHLEVDGSSSLVSEEVIAAWQSGDSRRAERREGAKTMRREMAAMARERGISVGDAHRMRRKDLDHLEEVIALSVIERFIARQGRAPALYHQWAGAKTNFPYFNEFVRNVVYQDVLFMTDHSTKLDANAQVDLDILTHLLRADCVVTNEAGFMRRAFADIWRPRGKVLFSTAEFSSYLEHL